MGKRNILTIILLALFLVSGLPVSAQLKTSPRPNAALNHKINKLKLRNQKIAAAMQTLKRLIRQPMPRGLSPKQQQEWLQQTKWLKLIQQRFSKYHQKANHVIKQSKGLSVAGSFIPGAPAVSSAIGKGQKKTPANPSGKNVQSQMNQMNAEFQALQNAAQMESRQFQSISNALKARHDIAMSSIRNTRS